MMNIVLLEPEIPDNTGNIGRTCVAAGARLHLIKPLGFDIGEKAVKRAGLDYWNDLELFVYENYQEFLEKNHFPVVVMATTKAQKNYTEVEYGADSFIMFGKESGGIPEEILVSSPETCVRIPMQCDIRSLNLSNAVAIVLYEALRQNGFRSLEQEGRLHRLHWESNRNND
ncbi:MAG: tRNA (cytidine(34)-2'-O)-methyltransferase [Bacillota bacterium]|nr:tRNA (cytidine(34)-2'-O)-methyltransferase [Bacillota bacterium]